MNMSVGTKVAVKALLGVNIILLCGFAFILMAILLENSPDLYERIYYATYSIQRLIVLFWVIALVFSPILAITLSLCFGFEIRKTVTWKISIVIMFIAELPSLALLGIGFAMRGI
jgi:hypothetical protein